MQPRTNYARWLGFRAVVRDTFNFDWLFGTAALRRAHHCRKALKLLL